MEEGAQGELVGELLVGVREGVRAEEHCSGGLEVPRERQRRVAAASAS